jgi:hypothetical protein
MYCKWVRDVHEQSHARAQADVAHVSTRDADDSDTGATGSGREGEDSRALGGGER